MTVPISYLFLVRYLRLIADSVRLLAYISDLHRFVEDLESHRRKMVWETLHAPGGIVSRNRRAMTRSVAVLETRLMIVLWR